MEFTANLGADRRADDTGSPNHTYEVVELRIGIAQNRPQMVQNHFYLAQRTWKS